MSNIYIYLAKRTASEIIHGLGNVMAVLSENNLEKRIAWQIISSKKVTDKAILSSSGPETFCPAVFAFVYLTQIFEESQCYHKSVGFGTLGLFLVCSQLGEFEDDRNTKLMRLCTFGNFKGQLYKHKDKIGIKYSDWKRLTSSSTSMLLH